MTSRVIVPLDGSHRASSAIRPAVAVAEQLGGVPVQAASVVADAREQTEREQALNVALASQGVSGAEVHVRVDASATDALLGLIGETSDAEVVMATHARGTIGQAVLGSVAGHLVTHLAQPVTLVGPEFDADWMPPVRTLIVCLDGSELSESMLGQATELARQLEAELRLIQVLEPGSGSGTKGDWIYLRRVAEHLQKERGVSANWDVLHGKDAARAIVDYAALVRGALIAMTTHGRTGLARALMGSVTNEVVHEARSPVVVMRSG
ncbi:MAG: universal stress protein [Spiribacter sp.]|jgi:nucleotide-binding universal stress UspA family protein|nr:universal stress protein [Spiribacter sp.]MDR9455674.1 universal stress protein [Spiribacter sp.]